MLSRSDREKFEEIRLRWETAQPWSEPVRMVGRKERQCAARVPSNDENSGTSTFRRKLSYGLSLISNPLSHSARKTTPPICPGTATSGLPRASLSLQSPASNSGAHNCLQVQRTTPPVCAKEKKLDTDATPKPLPRSRTTSFIPRPNRKSSYSLNIESDEAAPVCRSFVDSRPRTITPSKIPTLSPPASQHRRSNLRQYTHDLTKQPKHDGSGGIPSKAAVRSPSKSSLRSYTTPNLMQGNLSSTRSASSTAPDKAMLFKPNSTIGLEKWTLKENTPQSQRYSKRLPQIKEVSSKPQGLTSSITAANRLSLSHSNTRTPTPNKLQNPSTPQATRKWSSQHTAQTPLAQQRAVPKQYTNVSSRTPKATGSTISQARLMGPVDPPTSLSTEHRVVPPPLLRSNTDNFQRRTFGTLMTPSRRTAVGIMSQSQVGVSREVRVPRSSTFHNLVIFETPPPLPTIPEKYRENPMPSPRKEENSTLVMAPRSSTKPFITVHSPAHKQSHLPASTSAPALSHGTQRLQANRFVSTGSEPSIASRSWSIASLSLFARARRSHQPKAALAQSLSMHNFDESANNSPLLQVADYMPGVYWAGRFQSRFDQWRTDAMIAQLDPSYSVPGPLGMWKLDQDGKASCHIFTQLRDLCVTSSAADSLLDFEYKYRSEHKLLGRGYGLYPLRKPNDSESRQGPIGRAVRKLTPRKSSFVSLLKGKGWNRDDSSQDLSTQDMSSSMSSRDS